MLVKCEGCGIDFYKFKSHVKRSKHHFHIRACRDRWQSSVFLAENNPKWKGEEVGYEGLHLFVRSRLLNPGVCSQCGKNGRLDLANKSGKYSRELSDWLWLCRKCHRAYDKIRRNSVFIKVGIKMIRLIRL